MIIFITKRNKFMAIFTLTFTTNNKMNNSSWINMAITVANSCRNIIHMSAEGIEPPTAIKPRDLQSRVFPFYHTPTPQFWDRTPNAGACQVSQHPVIIKYNKTLPPRRVDMTITENVINLLT